LQSLPGVTRLALVAAAVVLSLLLFTSLVLAMPPAGPNSAPAAPADVTCVNDIDGANDQPGQKDLTRFCLDTAGLPVTLTVGWNWDETSWPGANTGDACALFDNDGNGNVDYSACVTVGGTPAALQVFGIYSCGDASPDRCTQPTALVPGPYQSSCTVSITGDDPFPAGADFPNDTNTTCVLYTTEAGGSSATLLDVCSYPAIPPNSDPSDCIETTIPSSVELSQLSAEPEAGAALPAAAGLVVLALAMGGGLALWRRRETA
jgi:hypothetical protein